MVLSIINQKNESGKPTIAINLIKVLTKKVCKTLLIDLNPEATLTNELGFNKAYPGFMDVLECDTHIEDVIVSVNDVIDIIPSDTTSNFMQTSLDSDEGNTESRFKTILSSVGDLYDYIIIDCPSDLSFVTLNAVSASDTVIVQVKDATNEVDQSERFSPKILEACIKLTGTTGIEPIKISNDEQIIQRINYYVGNNVKVLLLESDVRFIQMDRSALRNNTTDSGSIISSEECLQGFNLHLN